MHNTRNGIKQLYEDEILDLKYQIEHLDTEILKQNEEMHDLKITNDREVKDVKEDLNHVNTQLDFEVKDKRKQVTALK
jgi:hypothetical protein